MLLLPRELEATRTSNALDPSATGVRSLDELTRPFELDGIRVTTEGGPHGSRAGVDIEPADPSGVSTTK